MAVSHSTNPHRLRNVFLSGIVIGVIITLVLGGLRPSSAITKGDFKKLDDRLASIEKRLATPSPTPVTLASPGTNSPTISQINKDPKGNIDKVVEVTGKVNSPHNGVGFILVDTDGTFLWVHYKGKIPTGTATAKGKIVELKDQLAQWKTEQGWPENDANLTAKLRDEKVFLEADNVT